MDSPIGAALRRFFTPAGSHTVSDPTRFQVCESFRLLVLGIDRHSRELLHPPARDAAFARLREHLFPNLSFKLDPRDVAEVCGRELWLTPSATQRWLAAAGRGARDASFGFLYAPYALVLQQRCVGAGWVRPPVSTARLNVASLQVSMIDAVLRLRFLPADRIDACRGDAADPVDALRAAMPGARSP